MSMDRVVGISIVQRDEVIAKEEDRGTGIGEGDEKSDLLGDGVAVENQRFLELLERV